MAKCPICGRTKPLKQEIIDHVEKEHFDEIPEGMSTAQFIYYSNHGRSTGLCRVCGKPTDWNEKTGKPKQLCNNPACKAKRRIIAQKNMIKVYGTDNLLNDPLHQEKMLANRRISGQYIWSDGKHKFTYTGSYEKFALEWLDKVYDYDPECIVMPGPVVYYDFNGEQKAWITDMFLPELNLVIEFKDGSFDRNTHQGFAENRKREAAKDKFMMNQTKYNYTKITNKNMMSLVDVMSKIRLNNIFEEDKSVKHDNPVVVIHESIDYDNDNIVANTFSNDEIYALCESISNESISPKERNSAAYNKLINDGFTLQKTNDDGSIHLINNESNIYADLYDNRSELYKPDKYDNRIIIYKPDERPIYESYQFNPIDDISFDDEDIDTLNESTLKEKLYPVYVLLQHSGTMLANVIKNVTNAHFSHSSISFDSTLRTMYSFGRKTDTKNPFTGTFKTEDILSDFFTERHIPYALYIVPCTKKQIELMKKRLNYFIKNATKFKYDFTGLIKNYFGMADNPEYKYFCSRFVADIINAGAPKNHPFIKEPSLMRPEDFLNTNFAIYVTGGYLSNYNPKYVDKLVSKILRNEEEKRAKEVNVNNTFKKKLVMTESFENKEPDNSGRMYSENEFGTWNPFDSTDNFKEVNESGKDEDAEPETRVDLDSQYVQTDDLVSSIASGIYGSNFMEH